MIKYLRTINSNIAPEIFEFDIEKPTSEDITVNAGTVFTFSNGTPVNDISEGKPRYLSLTSWPKDGTKLRCIKIMEGMVFSATTGSDPSGYKFGRILELMQGENNCYTHCGDGSRADAEILYFDPANDSEIIVTLL